VRPGRRRKHPFPPLSFASFAALAFAAGVAACSGPPPAAPDQTGAAPAPSLAVTAPLVLAWPARAPAGDDPRGRAGVTLVFATAGGDGDPPVRHISPVISGEIKLTPSIAGSIDWGMSHTSYPGPSSGENSHLGPNNPLFAVRSTLLDGRSLTLRGSFGVAAPLAFRAGSLSDRVTADLGYSMAARARGFMDPWAWSLNTVSLVNRWSAEKKLTSRLALGGYAAVAALLPISEPIATTRGVFQARAEVTYAIAILKPGLAAQLSTSSRPLAAADFTAFSLEPFLEVEARKSFARLGLVLNLGAPGDAAVAPFGFQVGGGARF